MALHENKSGWFEKRDLIHLTILLAIALGIGLYLIATMVLIAEDGVFYLKCAREFSNDPLGVIKGQPFGYPFLIFATHKLVQLLTNRSSVYMWIYSAQGVTLFTRLMAIVTLYFIGKFLVGSKGSFWAVLILIVLPYPARFGSDVLRDWPYILLLAIGFLLLLRGAKQCRCWMFGAAGFTAGLGQIIRPECAQIIIYGLLWLLIRFALPKPNMNRIKSLCALFVLLIGFALPAVPCMKVKGAILPEKLKTLISSSCQVESNNIQEWSIDTRSGVYLTTALPGNLIKAIARLMAEVSDNLMYFFILPLMIGIYSRLRRKSSTNEIERFFILVFIALNGVILLLLYCIYSYISRRHSLPLVTFTIFYIPVGLQIWGDWWARRLATDPLRAGRHPQLWFFILLAVGIAICLPKLFTPLRTEKQGYRTASEWLTENTPEEALIAVPDFRISFYAQRNGFFYDGKDIPEQPQYAVIIADTEDEKFNLPRPAEKKYSGWVDQRKKQGKKIVIYKMM